jgi:DUF1365 family protein
LTAPAFTSAIYAGTVMHRRTRPKRHRLSYEVYSFLLDLAELPALDRHVRGFGYNRANLVSFHDADHGPGTGAPLRPWVDAHLQAAGIDLNGGPVRLMCYPRVLGYVFNPLSVYFCYRRDGSQEALAAILYEVTNTFKQRHTYLIPVTDTVDGLVRQACDKRLYVSPFIAMDMTYHFRVRPPDGGLAVAIHETDPEGTLLFASFSGVRRELSSATTIGSFLRFPMLTLKVIGGIHWEALKLWLKGVPLVHRPAPPTLPVSIVMGPPETASIGHTGT